MLVSINRFNPHTASYLAFAKQELQPADVEELRAYFEGKPVIEGFYQLTLEVVPRQTWYTCHPDPLSMLRAGRRKCE